MARLTKTQAVTQLTAYATIVAVDERDREFEFQPSSADGTLLTATTARLRLASASLAKVRVHDSDGRPWLVTLRVESAVMRDAEQAEMVLRAVGLRLDLSLIHISEPTRH